ncbi:MAG: magnesium transporter [Candidatus Palauibacterales bacterium]|nr:magnesium transporter [Candidatus Palauibacterales bacterium]
MKPEERGPYLQSLLEQKSTGEVREYFASLHPSDVADLLEDLNEDERLWVLSILPTELASESLAEMEEAEHPGELLTRLDPDRVDELVAELADDDAADLIGELGPEEQARVLSTVEGGDEIQELLEYPEETAGGIMTRDLIAVPSGHTCGEALDEIRRQAAEMEDFYSIFVTDRNGNLRGVVSLQDLVLAQPGTPILEEVEDPPALVSVETDQEDVGRALSRYNMASIGVVDPLNRLVGRVTFDDVIDVIEAETTEDILRFAAVSDEEEVRGGTREAIRSRLPWLIANLGTAALAASVVWYYQDTIDAIVTLAAVMPIIAGMGGNAGTQALAVTVRRIAVADESLTERWRVVGKEVVVGLVNGLVLGGILALAGLFLAGQPMYGLVVMMAMWGNLIVASFAGAFIPIFLESLGVDPAVASSIFVTALTDLAGFFLLLGLASALLL